MTEFLHHYNNYVYDFNDLEFINKSPALVENIETFIEENFKLLNNCDINNAYKLKISIMKKFRKFSLRVAKEHNTKSIFIALYFSFDTKLYPLLIGGRVKRLSEILNFKSFDYSPYIDGTSISIVFNDRDSKDVSIIKNNLHCLPRSFQNKAHELISMNLPKSHFDTISNKFQYNAFVCALKNDFNPTEIDKHLYVFCEHKADYIDNILSIYYLHTCINELEHMFDNRQEAANVKSSIMNKFCLYFFHFIESAVKYNSDDRISYLYNAIKNNDRFINEILYIYRDSDINNETIYFLLSLISEDIDFLHFQNKIFRNIQENFEAADFDLNVCSNDFKAAVLNEHYKQFRANHNNFPLVVKLEGK